MSKNALIIGSTPAGLQAALDIANAGIHVHLIEESPFLGADGLSTLPKHLLNTHYLEIIKQVLENRTVKLEEITVPHDLIAARFNILESEAGDYNF